MSNVSIIGQSEELELLIKKFNLTPKISMNGKGTIWRTLMNTFGNKVSIGTVISILNSEPQLQEEMAERHEGFRLNV